MKTVVIINTVEKVEREKKFVVENILESNFVLRAKKITKKTIGVLKSISDYSNSVFDYWSEALFVGYIITIVFVSILLFMERYGL